MKPSCYTWELKTVKTGQQLIKKKAAQSWPSAGGTILLHPVQQKAPVFKFLV